MRNLPKKTIPILLVVAFILLFSIDMTAQPPGPPAGNTGPPGSPINGLIALALVVGAYFGVKKLRK